jgi:hypothetical protein
MMIHMNFYALLFYYIAREGCTSESLLFKLICFGKVQAKLSLYLIKQYAMKTYGGVEV